MDFVVKCFNVGQAHEGSSYASQKVLQMAWHRSEHARSKVMELERNKNQMLAAVSHFKSILMRYIE